MTDPHRTLRATVEAVVPRSGPETEAEGFLATYLARMGILDDACGALDLYAFTHREGSGFADLDLDTRQAVLRTMAAESNADIQQLHRLLVSLALAAVYGEWPALDESGTALEGSHPVWERIGFPGPSTGYELPEVDRG